MCSSTGGLKGLMGKLYENSLSTRLRDKISKNDPLSKKLGYEGLGDPFGDAMRRGLDLGPSPLEKKRNANRDARAQAARDAEATPTGGHIMSIAAKKARLSR